MSVVPIYEALFWPGDSPLNGSGEVDFEALAGGLSKSSYGAGGRRATYTRAQHGAILSEAVDALAALDIAARSVLAVHAWLAYAREDVLNDGDRTSGRNKTAWRTMDIEALAEALAHTCRWERGPCGRVGPMPGASAIDRLLERLAGFDEGDRRKLSLYALFSEIVPAGLGTAVSEAALGMVELAPSVPAAWVEVVRLVRRMADAAVRRDVPVAGTVDTTSFPALERRIDLLGPAAAARLWLARYESLRATESTTGEH